MHKKQSNTGFSSFASAGPVYILKHDFTRGRELGGCIEDRPDLFFFRSYRVK